MCRTMKSITEQLEMLNDKIELLDIKQEMVNKKLNDLFLEIKITEGSIIKDLQRLMDKQQAIINAIETSTNRQIVSPKIQSKKEK